MVSDTFFFRATLIYAIHNDTVDPSRLRASGVGETATTGATDARFQAIGAPVPGCLLSRERLAGSEARLEPVFEYHRRASGSWALGTGPHATGGGGNAARGRAATSFP